MTPSNFRKDLSKEEQLSKYLDRYYLSIFEASGYSVERISDLDMQHRGVDLVLKKGDVKYYVDEKAQLDYLNKSLPTFAFELSYLKNKNWCQGWLLDENKWTAIYFLVTEIHTKDEKSLENGLSKIKITGIYRDKLLALLAEKGLDKERLEALEKTSRAEHEHGRIVLPELHQKEEGFLYFSKNNKAEQPINLVLKLNFLVKSGVGKVLFQLGIWKE